MHWLLYNMSAYALLGLFNELGENDKMRNLPRIYHFFAMRLINLIKQEHECGKCNQTPHMLQLQVKPSKTPYLHA